MAHKKCTSAGIFTFYIVFFVFVNVKKHQCLIEQKGFTLASIPTCPSTLLDVDLHRLKGPKWIILWTPLQLTHMPKAMVQMSTRMQPVSCAISCKTTSLFDFQERLCSISMSRFLGSLLSLANTESPLSCMKREYNVEHWFMVWQYIIFFCVLPLISFSSFNNHWK